MDEGIPKFVLDKHPEMVQVFDAIKQFKDHHKATIKCIHCNSLLSVYEDRGLGFLNVSCECGRSSYRSKWDPSTSVRDIKKKS